MFGYATDETEECMPLTVVLAHRLNQRIAELRRSGEFWWARPDSKTQVNIFFVLIKINYLKLFKHDDILVFATLDGHDVNVINLMNILFKELTRLTISRYLD